jgi:hypothetical protein
MRRNGRDAPKAANPHTWDRPGRADPKVLIAARETWNAVSDDAFQFVVL